MKKMIRLLVILAGLTFLSQIGISQGMGNDGVVVSVTKDLGYAAQQILTPFYANQTPLNSEVVKVSSCGVGSWILNLGLYNYDQWSDFDTFAAKVFVFETESNDTLYSFVQSSTGYEHEGIWLPLTFYEYCYTEGGDVCNNSANFFEINGLNFPLFGFYDQTFDLFLTCPSVRFFELPLLGEDFVIIHDQAAGGGDIIPFNGVEDLTPIIPYLYSSTEEIYFILPDDSSLITIHVECYGAIDNGLGVYDWMPILSNVFTPTDTVSHAIPFSNLGAGINSGNTPPIFGNIQNCLPSRKTQSIERKMDIKLSPNPVTDRLHIQTEVFDSKILQFFIYDSQGKLVREEYKAEVSGELNESIFIGNMPKGVYILQISNGNEITSKKFIIN